MLTASSVLLNDDEIAAITRYRQPSKQLAELHRQGFYRARMGRVGGVVLERAHFEAVCAGRVVSPGGGARLPKLRPA